MKTLLIVAVLALAGCAAEYHCPKAPKAVALFSVGDRVAWTETINEVVKGETGTVVDIEYAGDWVIYAVKCDKDNCIRSAFQIPSVAHPGTLHVSIEAIVYPDGALKP